MGRQGVAHRSGRRDQLSRLVHRDSGVIFKTTMRFTADNNSGHRGGLPGVSVCFRPVDPVLNDRQRPHLRLAVVVLQPLFPGQFHLLHEVHFVCGVARYGVVPLSRPTPPDALHEPVQEVLLSRLPATLRRLKRHHQHAAHDGVEYDRRNDQHRVRPVKRVD